MNNKLVGFGELLLRLDPPGHLRLAQADQFQAKFTGGEANTLVAAKRFGVSECIMVSRVPQHELGTACVDFLKQHGLSTESIVRGGDRLGILFVETGASLRPSRVIYDRTNTAFQDSDPQEYGWNTLLKDASIVHITGTAPALGAKVNQALNDCFAAAKQNNCLVSFDCSYRSALWNIEDASRAYRQIAKEADILFASPEDAELFFGFTDTDPDQRIQRLLNDYGLRSIAWTQRQEISASTNRLSGVLWGENEKHSSQDYEFEIIDRIGSGDAFAAGILASFLQEKPLEHAIEFATAAAVLKHTVVGDFCLVSASEVEELLAGKSLRIRR
ncbi:MAG: sugar kinase [Planctomycetota bacterium]|nr:sugar kinase [Planctomycetota bacterium]MEC9095960.1 sugar kinase [Planctomycetota bacterium]